jgi:hypothetical protein
MKKTKPIAKKRIIRLYKRGKLGRLPTETEIFRVIYDNLTNGRGFLYTARKVRNLISLKKKGKA